MRHKVVIVPFDYGAFPDSKCLRRKLHIPHGDFHDRRCWGFGSVHVDAEKTRISGRRFQIRQGPQIGAARDLRNEYS
jgi:hypothetical protein